MKAASRIKFIISIVLSIALGGVFAFSAFTKLYPVEPFEYTFIDIGMANWLTAPFIARLLIGLEFFCALLLILNFRLKRFTIPLVISLLIIFCIYLALVILAKGNNGNCGCFGEFLAMTPVQAIYKNIVLLLISLSVYFLTVPISFPRSRLVFGFTFCLCFALPFILNRVDLDNSKNMQPLSVNYTLPLDILYANKDSANVPPSIDLRHGKHIIAFLSLRCPHCKVAAQKISIMHKRNPAIPYYIVFYGQRELYQPYIDTYQLSDIPHQLFFGLQDYIKMAGTSIPNILWVNDGIVEKKGGYEVLPQAGIEQWLSDSTSAKH